VELFSKSGAKLQLFFFMGKLFSKKIIKKGAFFQNGYFFIINMREYGQLLVFL